MPSAPWVIRSLLFVPGNRMRLVEKARTLPADAVILDLEDSVPEEEKAQARATVSAALAAGFPESQVVWIRVNAPSTGLLDQDLREAFHPRADGVCLPKCESEADVLACEVRLRALEDREGLAPGTVRLLPLIESPQGVLAAFGIARASPRVWGIAFGAEDFTADLGVERTRAGEELAAARAALSLAAHAAGVEAVDGIYADFHDEAGLRAEAVQVKRLGFTGKMVIHPAQIAPVHEAFAPTPEEVARAQRIVAAFDEARARGSGVVVVDGAMVDRPVVLRAQRVLELARRMRSGTG